jgi:hypothetical protein
LRDLVRNNGGQSFIACMLLGNRILISAKLFIASISICMSSYAVCSDIAASNNQFIHRNRECNVFVPRGLQRSA